MTPIGPGHLLHRTYRVGFRSVDTPTPKRRGSSPFGSVNRTGDGKRGAGHVPGAEKRDYKVTPTFRERQEGGRRGWFRGGGRVDGTGRRDGPRPLGTRRFVVLPSLHTQPPPPPPSYLGKSFSLTGVRHCMRPSSQDFRPPGAGRPPRLLGQSVGPPRVTPATPRIPLCFPSPTDDEEVIGPPTLPVIQ